MTFPTTQGRFTGVSSTTNATTWAIPSGALPTAGNSNAGDMLLIFLSVDGTTTAGVTLSGLTNLTNARIVASVTDAAQVTGHLITGVITTSGVAAGLTFNNNGDTQQYSCVTLQMRSSTGNVGLAAISNVYYTSATGSSTNSNPAAFDPDGAAVDYTFISSRHGDSTTVATVAPTNYGNLQSIAGGGTTGASTNTAERQLNTAASEDPGTFTSSSEQWVCFTVAVCERALASTLTDNFDDNSLDTAKWTNDQFYSSVQTAGGTATEQNGRLEIAPAVSSNRVTGYVSVNKYSLIGSSIYTKVTLASGANYGALNEIADLTAGPNNDNYYAVQLYQTDLVLKQLLAGVQTNSTTLTYVAATHAWWRLRESGGTVYFDTAPSSASNPPSSGDWTNQKSMAVAAGIDLANSTLALQCGCVGADASPITTYFDGFNVATSASNSATLTATTAAYVITGTAIKAEFGHTLIATASSYSLTGTSVLLRRGYPLTATTASYILSGTTVTFKLSRVLAAAASTYSITSTVAKLEFGRKFAATASSYIITPATVVFRRGYNLTATATSYTVSGTTAALLRGRDLIAVSGGYVISGTVAALAFKRRLAAIATSYALTATATALLFGRKFAAAAGAYAISGTVAALRRSRNLVATSTTYAITGTAVQFVQARRLSVVAGSYILTGTDATLTFTPATATNLVADIGTYSLTGTPISLTFAITFVPSTLRFVAGFRENLYTKLGLTYTYNMDTAGNWRAVAEALEARAGLSIGTSYGTLAYQRRAAIAYDLIAGTSSGFNIVETPGHEARLVYAMETHAGQTDTGSLERRLMKASERVPL